MEISQWKRSMQEIARTVGAMVEEKLGDRSQLEEQVRGVAKQVERMVTDAIGTRLPVAKVQLKFKRLPHFRGELPTYATPGASGMDVRACTEEDVVLQPMARTMIPTGLSVEIPLGYEIQVRPRSGLAIMKGLGVVNAPGTIDADYRGEIKVIVINLGNEPITIQNQERIAQLVLCPVTQAEIVEESDLSVTERAQGGFGSTGI